jgi:hypothetical protein
MPESSLSKTSEPTTESEHSSTGMLMVRYGLGGVMVLGGIVMPILSPAGLGVDGFAMAVGGGLSVLLLNFMYRLSVSGELDREREEQARAYFDEQGEWPADEPTETGHTWVLPVGVVTFEQELAQLGTPRLCGSAGRSEYFSLVGYGCRSWSLGAGI